MILDENNQKLLKLLLKKETLSYREIEAIFGIDEMKQAEPFAKPLIDAALIDIWEDNSVIHLGDKEYAGYKITNAGREYFSAQHKETHRFLFPIVLSAIVAFICAVLPLLASR
jgi:hypothetical protein